MKTVIVTVFCATLACCFLEVASEQCFSLTKIPLQDSNKEIQGWKNVGNCPCGRASRAAMLANVPGAFIPACGADGKYHGIQMNFSSGQSWCADKETGNQIKDFVSPGSQAQCWTVE